MPSGPPELSRIEIDDAQIEYLAYGDKGPAVVLLHATGFLPWLWHPIAKALSDDYRVIAPCLFGHRASDPYKGGLGWRRLAEDVALMCGRLGIERPFFVGHSMGAAVGMLAHAVQGADSAGMVLIEPIFLPAENYRIPVLPEQHPLAAKALKRRNSWPDRQAVWEDFGNKPFFRSWDAQVLALYIEYGTRRTDSGTVVLTCSPRQEASLFMGGMQHDPWPELPKVRCPVLVVEGAASENRHWIDLKRTTGMIPRGRYAQVAGAGHLIPMEKPGETLDLIRTFLDSVR